MQGENATLATVGGNSASHVRADKWAMSNVSASGLCNRYGGRWYDRFYLRCIKGSSSDIDHSIGQRHL